MTSERTREGHPSDLELVAWIDDPGIGPDLSAHLATCDGCRDRVARLTAIRGAIALDPPMPSGAEFAAQRERILEAIERASREGGGRTVRRSLRYRHSRALSRVNTRSRGVWATAGWAEPAR